MTHEHEYEHVHYDDDGNAVIEEHKHSLFKKDRRELKSVGIDIGSTTSHLVFSTLELRRQGAALSSRFAVVARRIDYRSPIMITPFSDGTNLDTGRLKSFFDSAYAQAGITPEQVDTGAVVTTGDAARKDNAAAVVALFSEWAGDFVCASAGPILEAKIAAYGSGAVLRSHHHDVATTVLNIDVGGGTSKLALVRDGKILGLAALNVGARLLTFDSANRLTKIETAARICSDHLKLGLKLGEVASDDACDALCKALAQALLEAASGSSHSVLTDKLMITEPLRLNSEIDVVLFSGGVAEFFYGESSDSYADLGQLLANNIRSRVPTYLPTATIELPKERIQATVIGASQFTVEISGNTISLGNPALLPLRDYRVVLVNLDGVEVTTDALSTTIKQTFERSEVTEGREPVALSIHWPHGPAFAGLEALCQAITHSLTATVAARLPVVVILDCDVARLVGENLSRSMNGYRDIICIDGVHLHDFDYVDISKEHVHTQTVTVVIKSLVFSG